MGFSSSQLHIQWSSGVSKLKAICIMWVCLQVEAARPWSSLQCSALAAAMTTMAELQAGLMDQAFFFKV